MKNIIGPKVSGSDFFGREKELKKMADNLANPDVSLFIPGPRRTGKSSIVTEFSIRNCEQYKCLYFNLQGRFSIIQFCMDLKTEIEKNHPDIVKKKLSFLPAWNTFSAMIQEIGISAIKIKTGKIEKAIEEILSGTEDLFIKLKEEKFIIILDEFSDYILNLHKRNSDDVYVFLQWLRRQREDNKIQFIITGSVNIVSTLEEMDCIDLVNEMADIKMLPLTEKEVMKFLSMLLETEKKVLSPEAEDFAVEKLKDGIPFYVKLFAEELVNNVSECREIDLSTMQSAYATIINGNQKELVNMHSRLNKYLKKNEFEAAKKILAHLSHSSMGFDDLYPYIEKEAIDKNTAHKILSRLIDESYIKNSRGKFSFVSQVVADWWKNKYGWEK